MGSCFCCGKSMNNISIKMTMDEIIDNLGIKKIPQKMTKEDRVCTDCFRNLREKQIETTIDSFFISTDKTLYSIGETIQISGKVKQILPKTEISLIIKNNNNIVHIDQLRVDKDNKFSSKFIADGLYFDGQYDDLPTVEGTYTIMAKYGDEQEIVKTTFEFRISKKYKKSSSGKYVIEQINGIPCLSLNAEWFEDHFSNHSEIDKIDVLFYNLKYKLKIFKKKTFGEQMMLYFFGGTWVNFDEEPVSDDLIIDQINLDTRSGLLNITSKSELAFKIQLTNKGQVNEFKKFLDFTNLRNNKVLNKTIKQIKLQNKLDIIDLEINSNYLQTGEELIHNLSNNRTKNNELIYLRIIWITNLRVINDIWAYPNNFPDHDELSDLGNLMNNIFNFTHDQYDDVIASNVKKIGEENIVGGINHKSSYWNLVQNSVDLSYNESKHHASSVEIETGNIIFMSKGKKFFELEGVEDPKGLVEMINLPNLNLNPKMIKYLSLKYLHRMMIL